MGNAQTGNVSGVIGAIVEVHGQKFKIEKQLGEGGFAVVFKVIEESTMKPYAMKRILAADSEIARNAEEEISVMKTCASPYIISYKAHSIVKRPRKDGHRSPTEYFVIMEFCPGGTLTKYLDELHGVVLPESQVLSIAVDICKAVRVLHTQPVPICHRDLKLDNILLSREKLWKLCDFGSCTTRVKAYSTKEEITMEEELIQQYTTPSYRAPEMANLWQRRVVGPKADVWAVGCIIFTVAFLKQPFQSGTNSSSVPFPKTSHFTAGFINLLKQIFQEDPDQRPDILTVVDYLEALQRGETPKVKKVNKSKKAVKPLPVQTKSKEENSSSDSETDSSESDSSQEKEVNRNKNNKGKAKKPVSKPSKPVEETDSSRNSESDDIPAPAREKSSGARKKGDSVGSTWSATSGSMLNQATFGTITPSPQQRQAHKQEDLLKSFDPMMQFNLPQSSYAQSSSDQKKSDLSNSNNDWVHF
uniref:non-specific serine/threonine protein kinase n=1 Tax=Spongospora subterranea TaxID=70186 RepID=A0A0H5QKN2_9EUKA|eukprot:CRZ02187.1 hypothetical protein [Spongospora subterranea]